MIDTKEIMQEQLRAICIYQFLKLYNILEEKIRDSFEKGLSGLDENVRFELYFYYGSKNRTYIDFETKSIKSDDFKFNLSEKFKSFTINNILKFSKQHPNVLQLLNLKITSVRDSMIELYFYDIVIKLLQMRNILAHEIIECNFSRCVIDTISLKKIEEQKYSFFEGFDLNVLDQMSKDIMYNYFYMELLLKLMDGEVKEVEEAN